MSKKTGSNKLLPFSVRGKADESEGGAESHGFNAVVV